MEKAFAFSGVYHSESNLPVQFIRPSSSRMTIQPARLYSRFKNLHGAFNQPDSWRLVPSNLAYANLTCSED